MRGWFWIPANKPDHVKYASKTHRIEPSFEVTLCGVRVPKEIHLMDSGEVNCKRCLKKARSDQ